jgi:hypothetical protein
VERSSCHCACGSRSACAARSTGLVSTRCTSGAAPPSASPAARRRRACRGRGRARHRPLRPPRARPCVGEAQADQLAEHLADLRRGGEIARRAQRITRCIIMRIGLRPYSARR